MKENYRNIEGQLPHYFFASFFLFVYFFLSFFYLSLSPCHVFSVSLPPVFFPLSLASFLPVYSFSIPRFRFLSLVPCRLPSSSLTSSSLSPSLSLVTSSSSPISLLLSLPPVLFDVSPCFLSFVKSSFLSHLVFLVLSCFKSQPAHPGVSESRYWRKRLNSAR